MDLKTEDIGITSVPYRELKRMVEDKKDAETTLSTLDNDIYNALSFATSPDGCIKARELVSRCYRGAKVAIACIKNINASGYKDTIDKMYKDALFDIAEAETEIYADMAIEAQDGDIEAEESEIVTALKHKMMDVLSDMADDHRYGDMPIDDMCAYVDGTIEWAECHAILDKNEISYLREILGEHIADRYAQKA